MPTWLDEMAGDDMGDSDIGAYGSIGDVGWPWKRRRRGKRVAMRRLQSATPGAPAHGWAQEPLGLTAAVFNLTSGLSLSVSQPLIRDLKIDSARQQLATSRTNRDIAEHRFW